MRVPLLLWQGLLLPLQLFEARLREQEARLVHGVLLAGVLAEAGAGALVLRGHPLTVVVFPVFGVAHDARGVE